MKHPPSKKKKKLSQYSIIYKSWWCLQYFFSPCKKKKTAMPGLATLLLLAKLLPPFFSAPDFFLKPGFGWRDTCDDKRCFSSSSFKGRTRTDKPRSKTWQKQQNCAFFCGDFWSEVKLMVSASIRRARTTHFAFHDAGGCSKTSCKTFISWERGEDVTWRRERERRETCNSCCYFQGK